MVIPTVPPVTSVKSGIVEELHGTRSQLRSLIKLLDILIDEARVRNDEISQEDLPWNQGKIVAWMELKDIIERDPPQQNRKA